MGYKALPSALLIAGLSLSTTYALAGKHAAPKVLTGPSVTMMANTCAGCHGPGGNSTGPATPGITGLSKGYFIGAMYAYKYGTDKAKIDAAVKANPSVTDPSEFVVYTRTGTIMDKIAKGYTDAEIVQMADYFSKKKFVLHRQKTDPKLAKQGQKLHKKLCEKCHENGGTLSEDDVGLLGGQWMPYLMNTMNDLTNGDRQMPKKMKSKMKKVKGLFSLILKRLIVSIMLARLPFMPRLKFASQTCILMKKAKSKNGHASSQQQ